MLLTTMTLVLKAADLCLQAKQRIFSLVAEMLEADALESLP